jgi:hypothetical protein
MVYTVRLTPRHCPNVASKSLPPIRRDGPVVRWGFDGDFDGKPGKDRKSADDVKVPVGSVVGARARARLVVIGVQGHASIASRPVMSWSS